MNDPITHHPAKLLAEIDGFAPAVREILAEYDIQYAEQLVSAAANPEGHRGLIELLGASALDEALRLAEAALPDELLAAAAREPVITHPAMGVLEEPAPILEEPELSEPDASGPARVGGEEDEP